MTVEVKSERRRKEQLESGALRTWLVSLLKTTIDNHMLFLCMLKYLFRYFKR